jgi:hypothetical protein
MVYPIVKFGNPVLEREEEHRSRRAYCPQGTDSGRSPQMASDVLISAVSALSYINRVAK